MGATFTPAVNSSGFYEIGSEIDFSKPLINATAKEMHVKAQMFKTHLSNIKALRDEYYTNIYSKATDFALNFEGWDNISKYVNTALSKINKITYVKDFLNYISVWLRLAYIESMQLRSLVTGQTFHYHILETDREISRHLTEEQYIETLFDDSIGFWGSLKFTSESIQTAEDFLEALKLFVDTRATEVSGDFGSTSLKKDALYQYLSDSKSVERLYKEANYVERTDKGKEIEIGPLSSSRRYELYTQLYYYKYPPNLEGWVGSKNNVAFPRKKSGSKQDDTGYFFSDERREAVNEVYIAYIKDKMHRDSISFSRTGDSVIDALNLIENKASGGAINLKTVVSLIDELSKINLKDVQGTIEKLQEVFTYTSTKKELESAIYNGAGRYGQKHIEEFIIKIVSL